MIDRFKLQSAGLALLALVLVACGSSVSDADNEASQVADIERSLSDARQNIVTIMEKPFNYKNSSSHNYSVSTGPSYNLVSSSGKMVSRKASVSDEFLYSYNEETESETSSGLYIYVKSRVEYLVRIKDIKYPIRVVGLTDYDDGAADLFFQCSRGDCIKVVSSGASGSSRESVSDAYVNVGKYGGDNIYHRPWVQVPAGSVADADAVAEAFNVLLRARDVAQSNVQNPG